MTIATTIHAAVSSIGAVFQDEAPQGQEAPYIVWTIVDSIPENILDVPCTPPAWVSRISADCFAVTRSDADSLALAFWSALCAAVPDTTFLSVVRTSEGDVSLRRTIADFSVIHRQP